MLAEFSFQGRALRAGVFALAVVFGTYFLWCAASGHPSSQTSHALVPLIFFLSAMVIRSRRQNDS